MHFYKCISAKRYTHCLIQIKIDFIASKKKSLCNYSLRNNHFFARELTFDLFPLSRFEINGSGLERPHLVHLNQARSPLDNRNHSNAHFCATK